MSVFFFSSRRRHTRLVSDWSSDVCSSDLMGVGVIKADFGEGAPLTGVYASGRTGWFEHNLYPVRYNKAAWEITKRATGDRSEERRVGKECRSGWAADQ